VNAEDGNSFPEDDTKNAIHVSISEQDFKILSFSQIISSDDYIQQ